MIAEENKFGNRGLSQFREQRYLNIESYRKNGNGVRTPVWFVENQGTLYVRTDKDTGKAKRIRGNPMVRVVACSFRGKPKGDWVEARAELATLEETEQAYALLKRKYRLQYRLARLVRRGAGKAMVLAIRARDDL